MTIFGLFCIYLYSNEPNKGDFTRQGNQAKMVSNEARKELQHS